MRIRNSGFTLLELMMAVSIGGVLMAIAVPSFQKTILDSRRTAVINELLGSIQAARGESMKRSRYVTVCPSRDGVSCTDSASDWSEGWIVYGNVDRDFSGAEPDAGEPVMQRLVNENSGIRISSGSRRAFTFRPFQINSDNGTITVCDARGDATPSERRAIVVNTVGRPRIATRKSDGSELDCP